MSKLDKQIRKAVLKEKKRQKKVLAKLAKSRKLEKKQAEADKNYRRKIYTGKAGWEGTSDLSTVTDKIIAIDNAKDESKKNRLNQLLDSVNYGGPYVNYVPSEFALDYLLFIKLVNDGRGEANTTPMMHMIMLDQVDSPDPRHENVANLCFRGSGKLQPNDSKIYTPKGYTTMGKIKKGDKVLHRDGSVTKVTKKTKETLIKCYEMHFNDGSMTVVGEDHLNIVWMYGNRKRERVLTTKQLLERPVKVKNRFRKDNKADNYKFTYRVPLCKAMEHSTKKFKVHPFVYGLSIACGNAVNAGIRIPKTQTKAVLERLDLLGIDYQKFMSSKDTGMVIFINGVGKQRHIIKNRAIKPKYLYGDISQRLDLLKGLLVGMGILDNVNMCLLTTVSETFRDQAMDLVRSLGGLASYRPIMRDQVYESYKVIIRLNNPKLNPFIDKERIARWNPSRNISKAISSIEYIGKKLGHCIRVKAKSHSYITDNYTVTHNTTAVSEYFILYNAIKSMPNFGEFKYGIFVTDTVENGVKKMRNRLDLQVRTSEFLKKYIKDTRFTDIRWEFESVANKKIVFGGFGIEALALNEKLYGETADTTIESCNVGDRIYAPNGQLETITHKSEIFDKPMYEILLEDGRKIRTSMDHINSVVIRVNGEPAKQDITTQMLSRIPLKTTNGKPRLFIENTTPVSFPQKKQDSPAYVYGLLMGAGNFIGESSCLLFTRKEYANDVEANLHVDYRYVEDFKSKSQVAFRIEGLNKLVKSGGIFNAEKTKRIIRKYKYGNIHQRVELLKGLMDANGIPCGKFGLHFSTLNEGLAQDVAWLVRSLGGSAYTTKLYLQSTREYRYRVKIHMNIGVFKIEAKLKRQLFKDVRIVPIASVRRCKSELSQCISITGETHQYLTTNFFRTHNTGVRGTVELKERPSVIIFDDIFSDKNAESAGILKKIHSSIYGALEFAMNPAKSKVIWNGTPFNAADPLYKAMNSPSWLPNVYPICEKFPCTKEEFKGAWEERFPYEWVKKKYDKAVANNSLAMFYRELMLQIATMDEKLVQPFMLQRFSRAKLMAQRSNFNFYATTDLTTTDSDSADWAVCLVVAINNIGDIFLVDGFCKKQRLSNSMIDLFRLVQKWKPLEVGVEVSGQQKGFLDYMDELMLSKNIFFDIARETNPESKNIGRRGFAPSVNKFSRFKIAVPILEELKFHVPDELENTQLLVEMEEEFDLITNDGIKSLHDDVIDAFSMLRQMKMLKPSAIALGVLPNSEQALNQLEYDSIKDPIHQNMAWSDRGSNRNDDLSNDGLIDLEPGGFDDYV